MIGYFNARLRRENEVLRRLLGIRTIPVKTTLDEEVIDVRVVSLKDQQDAILGERIFDPGDPTWI